MKPSPPAPGLNPNNPSRRGTFFCFLHRQRSVRSVEPPEKSSRVSELLCLIIFWVLLGVIGLLVCTHLKGR